MMWNHWKIFDNMTWIMIYLAHKMTWKLGLWGQYSTPLKVAQIDMHTKTDAQPVEIFWENDQDRNFDLFGGPKWPQNWASEAHILHTSKSTWNEHVKQYCCETSENFLRNYQTPQIFLTLGPKIAQKLGPWGPYFTHLWK